MEKDVLTVLDSGKQYPLKPIGDVRALPCLPCMALSLLPPEISMQSCSRRTLEETMHACTCLHDGSRMMRCIMH